MPKGQREAKVARPMFVKSSRASQAFIDWNESHTWYEGADEKPLSKTIFAQVKGRLLSKKSNKAQAEKEFERAIEIATEYELWLAAALVLRDMLVHVHTSGSRNTSTQKRLGGILRKLKGPANMLTDLLGNQLDATKLMLL